jgi:hypothetical protein
LKMLRSERGRFRATEAPHPVRSKGPLLRNASPLLTLSEFGLTVIVIRTFKASLHSHVQAKLRSTESTFAVMSGAEGERRRIRIIGTVKLALSLQNGFGDDQFNYYGPVTSFSERKGGCSFLARLTDGKAAELQKAVQHFLDASYKDYSKRSSESAAMWFTIRTFKPNERYKLARWHQDGRYFNAEAHRIHEIHYKYATMLLGPPTLFL